MLYCLNPSCPHPVNPAENRHCQYCGDRLALRNRFRPLRLIGKGGFGKTYLAQDQDNRNKLCVLKRFTYLNPDPACTQKAEQLFEQEAERLDQLVHPQIPRLLAYFQEGEDLYLVQEFIVGKTLQAELNEEGKFSEARIREVLQGLLPILKFVHSRKVIHRDIKPDNIMRRQSGELVLIDFGIAKLLEQSNVLPTAATTIGTPGYAAPEQIQGRVTPASDLFALGATCFQLLTKAFTSGQVSPVEYDWVQRWQQHADSSISPELSRILSRLITLDDRQRYPTAIAVLKDLSPPKPTTTTAPATSPGDLLSQVATVAVSPASPAIQAPTPVAIPARPTVGKIEPTVASLPNKVKSPLSQAKPKPIRSVSVGSGFWLKYGLFTNTGSAVGFAFAMVAAVIYVYFIYGSDADSLLTIKIFSYLYSLLGGILVGIGQWLTIRKQTHWAFGWLPATAIGFAAGVVTFMNINNRWFSGLLIGAFAGSLHWIALLQRRTPRARWWILWMAVMYAMTFRTLASNQSSMVYAIAWFAIVPFLDGLFLSWVLRTQYNKSK